MKDIDITRLREHPKYCPAAARWFSQKWRVPLAAYQESMKACIAQGPGIPQWYLVLGEAGEILAGAGVIENDFHNRRDLTPNLCALYVEEPHRKKGLAAALLGFARADLAGMGIQRLYLITDHTRFYERCGWEYLTDVEEEGGGTARMYTAPTKL